MTDHPPWIGAYLVHALGITRAAACVPTGRVQRCMRSGQGSCGRLGYWFREGAPFNGHDGLDVQMHVVVWDGKTPYGPTAVEMLGCDPDRPYGLDTGRIDHGGFFSCGWCGTSPAPAPARRHPPSQPPKLRPPKDSPLDEARREELERWAAKLESVNPAMAAKVRLLIGLLTRASGEGET